MSILVWTQHLASAIRQWAVGRAVPADKPLETNIEMFDEQQAAISIELEEGSESLLIHKHQSGGSSRLIDVL